MVTTESFLLGETLCEPPPVNHGVLTVAEDFKCSCFALLHTMRFFFFLILSKKVSMFCSAVDQVVGTKIRYADYRNNVIHRVLHTPHFLNIIPRSLLSKISRKLHCICFGKILQRSLAQFGIKGLR